MPRNEGLRLKFVVSINKSLMMNIFIMKREKGVMHEYF